MPLGADPDKEDTTDWDAPPRTRRGHKFDPKVAYLINRFAYHKAMQDMTRKCGPQDKQFLGYTFNRLLRQGFTEKSLVYAIDRFFQSWAGDTDHPAPLFCKKDILAPLLSEAEFVTDDPYLQWFMDGMLDANAPLDEPKEYRKQIILNCNESLRYPEVIADILRVAITPAMASVLLRALESVVKYNLAGKPYNRLDVEPHLATLATIKLPKELRSWVPSPKSVRPKLDRMASHVAASVVSNEQQEWS